MKPELSREEDTLVMAACVERTLESINVVLKETVAAFDKQLPELREVIAQMRRRQVERGNRRVRLVHGTELAGKAKDQ